MNIGRWRTVFLLAIAILGLIKATWGLVSPGSLRRAAQWWMRALRNVNTLAGGACFLVGLLLLAWVLVDQPLVNWALIALGLLFLWGGTVCGAPERMERVAHRAILDRGPGAIRALSLVSAVVCVLLIWIALAAL